MRFLLIYFNIVVFLIFDCIDLLFFSLRNKLDSFLKYVKNCVIPIIPNTFVFKANHTIAKNAT